MTKKTAVKIQNLNKSYKLADNSYKKALLLKPNYADAYCNLGMALQFQANF